jgi:N-acetylglucosaminyldiphosphoundecaprenol N-acetyl-beta-D-mannosaminyltransferase
MLMRYQEASFETEAGREVEETSAYSRPVVSSSPDSEHARSSDSANLDEMTYIPVVRLMGVELHAITEKKCIDLILKRLDEGIGGTVVTPNLDILRRCTKDLMFATLVSESDLVVADGMPLIWASRLQGTPLPGRIAGSDLIYSLSEAAAHRGRSIFLLGGDPGVADGAARILQQKYPTLKIAGTYVPPFGFENKSEEMSRMIDALTKSKPDIVWVALGSPKQEQLIHRIRGVLPSSWWLGVGISFSFLTGDVKRAPKWVQKLGLEWFHRVIQEPKRLFKRYFIHGLPFAVRLMISAVTNRKFGSESLPMAGHRHRNRWTARPTPSPSGQSVVTGSPEESKTPSLSESEISPVPPSDSDRLSGNVLVFSRSDSTLLGRGLKRLKAVILLGGKMRESPLSVAIRRSRLDLPLDENTTILNHWLNQCHELAGRALLESLTVRVSVDKTSIEPKVIDPRFTSMVQIERDRASFRGTGGLVADIASDYDDDDLLLVGSAHQVLLDPLWAIAAALDHKTGDFTLISHRDGTASGLMLFSCRTVREISKVGFIDLKEQALPQIAKHHDVRVVHCRQPTGLPLFTLSDYITALQQYYRRRERRRARMSILAEDHSRHFVIVEQGATVAADSYLHDTVVLKDAVIEPGAAVVRSLVCPGAVVPRNRTVIDQLVKGSSN